MRITTEGCSEWSCLAHGEANRQKTELRDRIWEAELRIATNDGRLSSDSSADLDLAQDELEAAREALADLLERVPAR